MLQQHVYDGHLYRRPNSDLSLEAQHNTLAGSYEGRESAGRRATPSSDSEVKSSLAHRKRVPVACERCRKRKIKCSGDEGEGRCCINCRNAGYAGCQFLRAHSQHLPMDPSTNCGRYWQQQHRWSPYGTRYNLSYSPQPQHSFQPTSLPYTPWQTELAYGGIAQGIGMPYARSSYSPAYTIYAPETVEPHTGHPPSYMLPEIDQSAYASMGTMHSLGRQQTAMWLDQINSVSLPGQSAHVTATLYPLTPVESTRSFAGLLELPSTSLSGDRTLPQPGAARSYIPTSSARQDAEPLSAVSYRSSVGWTADTPSNVSYASSRTSCGDVYDLTPVSSSVDCSGQTLSHSYEVISASPHIEVPVLALPFGLDAAPQQPISDIRSQPLTNTKQGSVRVLPTDTRALREDFHENRGHGKTTKRKPVGLLNRSVSTNGQLSCSWRESEPEAGRDMLSNSETQPAFGSILSALSTQPAH